MRCHDFHKWLRLITTVRICAMSFPYAGLTSPSPSFSTSPASVISYSSSSSSSSSLLVLLPIPPLFSLSYSVFLSLITVTTRVLAANIVVAPVADLRSNQYREGKAKSCSLVTLPLDPYASVAYSYCEADIWVHTSDSTLQNRRRCNNEGPDSSENLTKH